MQTARLNQASGLVANGQLKAIPARAADIHRSSPLWNFTTMVKRNGNTHQNLLHTYSPITNLYNLPENWRDQVKIQ